MGLSMGLCVWVWVWDFVCGSEYGTLCVGLSMGLCV